MNKLIGVAVKSVVGFGANLTEKSTIVYLSKGASRAAVAGVCGTTLMGMTVIVAGTYLISKIIEEKEIEIKIGNFEIKK